MKEIIEKTAKLACISPENNKDLIQDMEEIILFASQLQNVKGAEPDESDFLSINAFREDEIENSLDFNDIEQIAPQFHEGYLFVPNVLEG